jgi:CTP:phosphocholine cytidylyltransferase-like protein
MILIKNIANYETSAETSVWVLMTNNNDFLQRDDVVINSSNDTIIKNVALWTDDYSNLFSVLK